MSEEMHRKRPGLGAQSKELGESHGSDLDNRAGDHAKCRKEMLRYPGI